MQTIHRMIRSHLQNNNVNKKDKNHRASAIASCFTRGVLPRPLDYCSVLSVLYCTAVEAELQYFVCDVCLHTVAARGNWVATRGNAAGRIRGGMNGCVVV